MPTLQAVRTSTFEVARSLLTQWHTALDAGVTSPRDGLEREVAFNQVKYEATCILADTIEALHVSATGIEALNDIIEIGDELSEPERAYAVAWAIDNLSGPEFSQLWQNDLIIRHQGVAHLTAGELVPIPSTPRELLADRATFPPWPPTVEVLPSDTPHLRRWSTTKPPHICIDASFSSELTAALRRLTHLKLPVVAVFPNADKNELTDTFPIAPTEAGDQTDLLRRALARTTGASIVIIPELAVTPQIVDAITAELVESEDRRLVILGSMHQQDADGTRTNDAPIIIGAAGGVVATHHKISPYRTVEDGMEKVEGIGEQNPPRITLFDAGPLRVAVLICLDLLKPSVYQQIAAAGANLILAPAYSPKTRGFEDVAAALHAQRQAMTVVVNGPLTHAATNLVILQPALEGPYVTHNAGAEPCIVSYDPATGEVTSELLDG